MCQCFGLLILYQRLLLLTHAPIFVILRLDRRISRGTVPGQILRSSRRMTGMGQW